MNDSVELVQLWEGGPYWADRNIGAENPWDSGYYFWWGDTVGYKRANDKWVASDGSNSDFRFEDSNTPTFDKSISELQREGWIAKNGVLASEHDAAQKYLGGNWRMPTDEEFEELTDKCDWIWSMMNGVKGYVVRGRGDHASQSIFLPSAGGGWEALLFDAGLCGSYWSAVPYSNYSDGAWYLDFSLSIHGRRCFCRSNGHSVRPLQGFIK